MKTAERESEAAEVSLIGTTLAGRYRIDATLGVGGMGTVYLAEHVHMRKAVAVKVLHPAMTVRPEVVARFEREAVAAARIDHPNVAAATDFGRLDDGSFYLALEFVEGHSLAVLIREQRSLDENRALRIVRQIADALAAAHASGIVHRDLKPDNVMLVAKEGTSDFVKVLDFGIAKVKLDATSEQPLTQLGVVFGTPEYMSPEQARGFDVDARSDLYTLGLISYELLSGTSPFRHDDLLTILARQITVDPDPLPESVSHATAELVMQLLRKDPAARVQSAVDLRDRLDRILASDDDKTAPMASGLRLSADDRARGRALDEVGQARTALALPVLAREPLRAFSTLVSRLRFQRRVTFGRYSLSLGAASGLGALLLVALLLGVTLLALGRGRGSVQMTSGSAVEQSSDPDLLVLVAKAEAGDSAALTALAQRPEGSRSVLEWRALGHGYARAGDAKASLAAYKRALAVHPQMAQDPVVLGDVRRAAERADAGMEALEFAAGALGPGGADLLFDVVDKGKAASSPALALRARALLEEESAKSHSSPALKALLALQVAMKRPKCAELKALLPEMARSADERAVPNLARLAERRGCGFLGLGDCYGCLRANSDLARALELVRGRPRPSFGAPAAAPLAPAASGSSKP